MLHQRKGDDCAAIAARAPATVYDAYVLGRMAVAPVNAWAASVRAFWSHPALALPPIARAAAAGAELVD